MSIASKIATYLVTSALAGCSGGQAVRAHPAEPVDAKGPLATTPPTTDAGRSAPTTATTESGPPSAPGEPSTTEPTEQPSSAPSRAEAEAKAEAGTESRLPSVRVENIGLHVGGGPNDGRTKAPFLRAVERKFDDFRRCHANAPTPAPRGTFGIDLHIPASGGHPETSNARTAMKGDEFRQCVVHVFESVEFDKPPRGATTISYALRFEPN